jgi:hypothetical protein
MKCAGVEGLGALVFWDVTSCSPVEVPSQTFRRNLLLAFSGQNYINKPSLPVGKQRERKR